MGQTICSTQRDVPPTPVASSFTEGEEQHDNRVALASSSKATSSDSSTHSYGKISHHIAAEHEQLEVRITRISHSQPALHRDFLVLRDRLAQLRMGGGSVKAQLLLVAQYWDEQAVLQRHRHPAAAAADSHWLSTEMFRMLFLDALLFALLDKDYDDDGFHMLSVEESLADAVSWMEYVQLMRSTPANDVVRHLVKSKWRVLFYARNFTSEDPYCQQAPLPRRFRRRSNALICSKQERALIADLKSASTDDATFLRIATELQRLNSRELQFWLDSYLIWCTEA
jgi:hypothetical protein